VAKLVEKDHKEKKSPQPFFPDHTMATQTLTLPGGNVVGPLHDPSHPFILLFQWKINLRQDGCPQDGLLREQAGVAEVAAPELFLLPAMLGGHVGVSVSSQEGGRLARGAW